MENILKMNNQNIVNIILERKTKVKCKRYKAVQIRKNIGLFVRIFIMLLFNQGQ